MFTAIASSFWQAICRTHICNDGGGHKRVEALSMMEGPNEAVLLGFGWDLLLKEVIFISVKLDDYGSFIFSLKISWKIWNYFLVVAKGKKKSSFVM